MAKSKSYQQIESESGLTIPSLPLDGTIDRTNFWIERALEDLGKNPVKHIASLTRKLDSDPAAFDDLIAAYFEKFIINFGEEVAIVPVNAAIALFWQSKSHLEKSQKEAGWGAHREAGWASIANACFLLGVATGPGELIRRRIESDEAKKRRGEGAKAKLEKFRPAKDIALARLKKLKSNSYPFKQRVVEAIYEDVEKEMHKKGVFYPKDGAVYGTLLAWLKTDHDFIDQWKRLTSRTTSTG